MLDFHLNRIVNNKKYKQKVSNPPRAISEAVGNESDREERAYYQSTHQDETADATKPIYNNSTNIGKPYTQYVAPKEKDELTMSYDYSNKDSVLERNKRERIKQLGAPHVLMQE